MNFAEQELDYNNNNHHHHRQQQKHHNKEEEEPENSDSSSQFPSSSSVLSASPVVNTNNHNNRGGGNGNQRRGRWQGNDRRFNAPRRDERFVSELKLSKSEETLSRKYIQYPKPKEVACFSRVRGDPVFFDDSNLRRFKRLINEDVGADLNEGFGTFIPYKELGSEGFGDLLATIRDKQIALQNMHFVTFRSNLYKIMGTAYNKHEAWEMGVHKRNGVVYLDVHKLPERPQSEPERRRSYWGYCFEALATVDPRRADGEPIHHVDVNVEFCAVFETKLGNHRILMGADIDCCDLTDDGDRVFVKFKTCRELDDRTKERFERQKLLKFWIQSFLAGIPSIVVGFRDDAGRLVRTERLETKDIALKAKQKNYWQEKVCLAFADEVLCWLYGAVKDDEDYTLQFVQPFACLELLKAPSCPEVITYHVEQLQV